jgi:hypothetical protein
MRDFCSFPLADVAEVGTAKAEKRKKSEENIAIALHSR